MTSTELEKIKLFFIIGRPRSGTTLLRTLLDAHPNVQIPTECNFILFRKYRNIDKWNDSTIDNFVNELKKTIFFKINHFDADCIRKELLKEKEFLNLQNACKILISSYKSIFPKKEILTLGNKNPLYSLTFKSVFSLFPDAKFIYFIRDPRDNHISIYNAKFEFPFIAFTVKCWKKSFQLIKKYKNKYPEQFYSLRYEDLVSDTELQLEKMCRFLSIPYDQQMLNYLDYKNDLSKEYPQQKLDITHKSLMQPIDKSKAGQWENKLSDKNIMIADWIAGKYFEDAGYKRKYNKISFRYILTSLPGLFIYYFIYLSLRISLLSD